MPTIFRQGQPSFGSQMGTGLGQGFGKGLGQRLSQLADMRMNKLLQQQRSQSFEEAGLPGILAQLDPSVQSTLLKEMGRSKQLKEQGLLAQQESQEKETEELDFNKILQLIEGNVQGGQDGEFQRANLGEENLTREQVVEKGLGDAFGDKKQASPIKRSREYKINDEIDKINAKISDPKTNQKVVSRLRAERDKKQENFDKRSDYAWKETKKFRDELSKEVRDSDKMIDALDRQKELNERGNLSTPGYLKMLEGFGFNIDALKSDDTQEFMKTKGAFFSNLKKLFGGRITDREVDLYMQTIANEYQSPEGRRRVIETLMKDANKPKVRQKAMDKLIAENANVPYIDLERRVDRESKGELNLMARNLRKKLNEKSMPLAESSIKTIAQAGLPGFLSGGGKAVGAGAGAFGALKGLGSLLKLVG